MQVNFNKQELSDLREALRNEIQSIKKDIRISQSNHDKRAVTNLYQSIDNYEGLEKKIASYIKHYN